MLRCYKTKNVSVNEPLKPKHEWKADGQSADTLFCPIKSNRLVWDDSGLRRIDHQRCWLDSCRTWSRLALPSCTRPGHLLFLEGFSVKIIHAVWLMVKFSSQRYWIHQQSWYHKWHTIYHSCPLYAYIDWFHFWGNYHLLSCISCPRLSINVFHAHIFPRPNYKQQQTDVILMWTMNRNSLLTNIHSYEISTKIQKRRQPRRRTWLSQHNTTMQLSQHI